MIRTLEGLKRKYRGRVERPDGVPRVAWPPHPGATRNWNKRTERIARFIEWKFDVACSTYNHHGSNDGNGGGDGERNAIDIWICQPKHAANSVQEEYGDRIQNFIENHPEDFPWYYIIWWNWIRYFTGGWFSYDPYWRRYAALSGNPNPADNKHLNHVHTQIRKGEV